MTYCPASPQAFGRWIVRIMRVLVVLLLVFDQLSSPLHHHHHDGGPHGLTQQLFIEHASAAHIEPADELAGHHSMTGIKREARFSPVFQGADDFSPLIVAPHLVIYLAAKDTQMPSWPIEARQSIITYRSLPPGGRAPPLLHT